MTKTKLRIYAAWTLLIGACIGWPLSQLTIASEEPPFILGLSWLAIILTALDLLSTQDVRDKQGGEDHNPEKLLDAIYKSVSLRKLKAIPKNSTNWFKATENGDVYQFAIDAQVFKRFLEQDIRNKQ